MKSLNRWAGIGHVVRDPEKRHTQSGTTVTSFTVACNDSWVDKSGEKQERVEYVNIVAWAGLGDVSEKYLSKGKQVYIEGKLQTRSWEDKEGNKRYTTEIKADNMIMLGGGGSGGGAQKTAGAASEPAPLEDDIPF